MFCVTFLSLAGTVIISTHDIGLTALIGAHSIRRQVYRTVSFVAVLVIC